ncbi:Ribosomal protein subunit S28, partial [Paramicrosporidium saccamoebae]
METLQIPRHPVLLFPAFESVEHSHWLSMLLVRRFSWCRTFATASVPDQVALRKANRIVTETTAKSKLDKTARPFNTLLANYYPLKKIHGVSSVKREGLGFGLREQDLEATGANNQTMERLLSLEMNCQEELKKSKMQQAMEMFCRGVNDTGSPEVQAAVWSVRIAVLENHARQYKHDYVAERKIVYYKDQRRKILRYLKRVSLER